MSDATTPLGEALALAALAVRHGPIPALGGVDLTLRPGEALALLGGNGAGKTTLLNAISGFLKPAAGDIRLFGQPIAGMPPHAIVRRGLLHVSQDRDLFADLSVLDNLKLGALTAKAGFEASLAQVLGLFPRLKERQRQAARTLSGGEQQMLAIGRALMARPAVLLLDEPSAGLAPLFLKEIAATLAALKQEGIAMLLVEQNLHFAAKIADRFAVLRGGRIVGEGDSAALLAAPNEFARAHYL
jgi:branched-chain amino acid transport system ATP-binding protein